MATIKRRLAFTGDEITELLIGLYLSRDTFHVPDKGTMSPVRAWIIARGRQQCEALIERLEKARATQ